MRPELRLIEYFVAVAETGNVTRAAERLHISQPSLSAAIRSLEAQLGAQLLHRRGRRVTLTEAGALLAERGAELLALADDVLAEVRGRSAATTGRLRLGVTPTARHGVLPRLLAMCADELPGIMIYTSEDTTGALLRSVTRGDLDAAITFCAPSPPPAGLTLRALDTEPAVVHLRADHPLAGRAELTLADLAGEAILTAASRDSGGFTDRILSAFASAGVVPRTLADPYPDLGLQAVREGLGVVIYARGAFPPDLAGSVFVALEPPLELPFHLATRTGTASAPLRALLAIASASMISTP
jgi:DNA-binding transcriptional LysR family regulator